MCLDTKKILAQKFMELSCEKNMKTITVRDVAVYCGVCKRTFYNYFHDVNEVVEWIFSSSFQDPAVELSDFDAFCRKTTDIFCSNWKFYKKAILNTQFMDWYERWLYENMLAFIKRRFGSQKITPELEICLKTWCIVVFRSLPELSIDFKNISPEYFFLLYREHMPMRLQEFFTVHTEHNEMTELAC